VEDGGAIGVADEESNGRGLRQYKGRSRGPEEGGKMAGKQQEQAEKVPPSPSHCSEPQLWGVFEAFNDL
jgi:hypothetical protein